MRHGREAARGLLVHAAPLAAALFALALLPSPLLAHGEVPAGPWDLWNHWPLRASVLIPLAVGALLYARGIHQLWQRAGVGRQISRTRAAAFFGGVLVLGAALATPLDPLGEVLFSAHMVQHLLLILVAAPLLIVGAPEVALMWALPQRARAAVGRRVAPLERLAADPEKGALLSLVVVATATVVLWAWHVPALYDLAIGNEAIHAAEHAAFLLTALLFWATVLRVGRRARIRNGVRVLLVFAMAVQGSVLGALITFAKAPLYDAHAHIAPTWAIAPLVDQQLAGLIMWIPPALLYIGVAAYLFVEWLHEVERRSRERERRQGRGATARPDAAMRREESARGIAWMMVLALALGGCADDPPDDVSSDDSDAVSDGGVERWTGNDGFLPAVPPDTPVTMGVGVLRSPETALWDSAADVYLVSNINGKLTAADGNGFISRIAPTGEVVDAKWISGEAGARLHGPKGMVFRDAGTLAVADVGAVRFFDRASGAPMGSVEIPQAYMLNDLALGADGTLYVSDVGDAAGKHPGAIYALDGGAPNVAVGGDQLERPDGLIPIEDDLLVASFAPHARDVYRLTRDGRRIPHAVLPQGQLDGLLRLPDGALLVTSWGGHAVYSVRGEDVERFAGGISTPAQIGYDAKRRRVLVPVLRENKLLVFDRPSPEPAPKP